MDLSQFVSQHIAIVVVGAHAKAAISPHSELHRSHIGQVVLQLATALRQQTWGKNTN
jgi:hypothetical protein